MDVDIASILTSSKSVDVHFTIEQLLCLPYVERVGVDSTLARHITYRGEVVGEFEEKLEYQRTLSGMSPHIVDFTMRRKALIVCYTADREDWEELFEDAKAMLKSLMFEVGRTM